MHQWLVGNGMGCIALCFFSLEGEEEMVKFYVNIKLRGSCLCWVQYSTTRLGFAWLEDSNMNNCLIQRLHFLSLESKSSSDHIVQSSFVLHPLIVRLQVPMSLVFSLPFTPAISNPLFPCHSFILKPISSLPRCSHHHTRNSFQPSPK